VEAPDMLLQIFPQGRGRNLLKGHVMVISTMEAYPRSSNNLLDLRVRSCRVVLPPAPTRLKSVADFSPLTTSWICMFARVVWIYHQH